MEGARAAGFRKRRLEYFIRPVPVVIAPLEGGGARLVDLIVYGKDISNRTFHEPIIIKKPILQDPGSEGVLEGDLREGGRTKMIGGCKKTLRGTNVLTNVFEKEIGFLKKCT